MVNEHSQRGGRDDVEGGGAEGKFGACPSWKVFLVLGLPISAGWEGKPGD